MDLEKSIRNVLLSVEVNHPGIQGLIKGFDHYNNPGFSKSKVARVYLKGDLKLLKKSRIVCKKNYDPPSYSLEHWIGIALAQVVWVLSKYLFDTEITWWDKMRVSSNLRTTVTLVGRAMKRFSWGDEAVRLIRAELKAIVKSKKTEKREKIPLLLFEESFAR